MKKHETKKKESAHLDAARCGKLFEASGKRVCTLPREVVIADRHLFFVFWGQKKKKK